MIKTALLIFLSFSVYSQNSQNFFEQTLKKNQKGMIVLGAWGVSNAVYSGANLTIGNVSSQQKAFHQMNVGWGEINTAIAGLGYFSSKNKHVPNSPLSILEEQQKVQQTFIVNGALDLGYMAFGLYLTERSKNELENSARLKGFGQSIILQGAGLALFDAVMYGLQKKHYNKNRQHFELTLSPSDIRLQLTFN